MNFPKPIRYSNPRYLDYVRTLPCADCGKPGPSDPHHESWIDGTRAGGKPDDAFALPLCRVCHTLHHTGHGMGRENAARALLRTLRDYLRGLEP